MRLKTVSYGLRYVMIIFMSGMLAFASDHTQPAEKKIGRLVVSEMAGLSRQTEYLEFNIQLNIAEYNSVDHSIIATNMETMQPTTCQLIEESINSQKQLGTFTVVFPVAINAGETQSFTLSVAGKPLKQETDLVVAGEGLELTIDNEYYRADLTKANEPGHSHNSGQIREIFIKMGINQRLHNNENRVHWAPNFKREEIEYYTTIAHWDHPKIYKKTAGPYLIRTIRQGLAPDHPEIMLSAVYHFYSKLPYFRFYSEMSFIKDLPLELLRNEEMTTEPLFTHLAYLSSAGELISMPMDERDNYLRERPIDDDAGWICFYNPARNFGFGCIRLRYDNTNNWGTPSPTYRPHTQIGEWMGRKYWNRRLIHDKLTLVPAGSRYIEQNAYLLYRIDGDDHFAAIKYWSDRLNNPLRVHFYPDKD